MGATKNLKIRKELTKRTQSQQNSIVIFEKLKFMAGLENT